MDATSEIAYRYYRGLESALHDAGYTIYLESVTGYDGSVALVVFSVGADLSCDRWAEEYSSVQFSIFSDGSKVTRIEYPTIVYHPSTQDELVCKLQQELNEIIDKTPASPGVFARILAGQFRRLGFKE